MEPQDEKTKKRKTTETWKPIALEAGKFALFAVSQGMLSFAGGYLMQRALQRKSGEVISLSRKAI